MKPELTREDRYIFYLLLAEYIKTDIFEYNEFDYGGFCFHISRMNGGDCGLIYSYIAYASIPLYVPELWAKQPVPHKLLWFPYSEEGWKQRLALVEQCITEFELETF